MDIGEQLVRALREKPSEEPAVAVIGDLGYDYIYTCPPLEGGREVVIRGCTRTIAGAAGYFACGLARMGATVYFLTELGDDPDGRQLLAEISERGIDASGVRVLENTGSYYTLIFAGSEEATPRQVATYLGPLETMSIRDLDYRAFAAGSQLVYSCNYFQLLTVRTEIGRLFAGARESGKITAYDANAGDGWEDPRNLELLRDRIYPQTDVVFLNEREAGFLTGERDALRALMKASPASGIVVVKRGPAGIVLREGQRVYRCAAFPPAGPVQDTVGAGDSFQAAFLYFHLRGFPVAQCAILGAANAASTVRHQGGVAGQLGRDGLAQMLERCHVRLGDDGRVELALR